MGNRKREKKNARKISEISKILFWKNKITMVLIGTSFVLNIIVWLGLFMLTKNGQTILIGHYNVFFGVDTIINLAENGNSWELFLPPMGGLFFLVVSILMSIFLILQLDRGTSEKEIKNSFVSNKSLSFMSSRLLLIGTWVVQLILVVYLISIWLINK